MTQTAGKRPGPASVFRGKVIARRSAVFTSIGNGKVDALRKRLAAEMGRPRELSIGDVFEALVHLYGDDITGQDIERIASEINARTEAAA